jgi:hypothetical protein
VAATVVALGTVSAAPAIASATTATTLQATSVTASSATLTGAVDSTDADIASGFQYGSSTAYDRGTGTRTVGPGFSFVQASVSGLKPSTTYHYRLIVLSGSYSPAVTYGSDVTFTTKSQGTGGGGGGGQGNGGSNPGPKYASTSLRSNKVKVKHGIASVRFRCNGSAGASCKAKIALSVRTKKGKTVGCGKGSLVATAGHSRTVRPKIGKRCGSLLKAAAHHRLRATLKAKFSSNQTPLRIAVTLVGT